MAHSDAREGKWRGNWRMEWVASTLHITSEHGVSSITTAHAHNLAASSRLNWRPLRFKLTRPFRRKTKSGFCACAITFETQGYIAINTYVTVCRMTSNDLTSWNLLGSSISPIPPTISNLVLIPVVQGFKGEGGWNVLWAVAELVRGFIVPDGSSDGNLDTSRMLLHERLLYLE
jgi:hypothetical protein